MHRPALAPMSMAMPSHSVALCSQGSLQPFQRSPSISHPLKQRVPCWEGQAARICLRSSASFWRHSSVGKDDRALTLRLNHYNKVACEHHMQIARPCAVCHGMCRMLLQHNEQLAGPRLVMRSSMSRLSGRGVDRSTRGMCARMQSSGEPS